MTPIYTCFKFWNEKIELSIVVEDNQKVKILSEKEFKGNFFINNNEQNNHILKSINNTLKNLCKKYNTKIENVMCLIPDNLYSHIDHSITYIDQNYSKIIFRNDNEFNSFLVKFLKYSNNVNLSNDNFKKNKTFFMNINSYVIDNNKLVSSCPFNTPMNNLGVNCKSFVVDEEKYLKIENFIYKIFKNPKCIFLPEEVAANTHLKNKYQNNNYYHIRWNANEIILSKTINNNTQILKKIDFGTGQIINQIASYFNISEDQSRKKIMEILNGNDLSQNFDQINSLFSFNNKNKDKEIFTTIKTIIKNQYKQIDDLLNNLPDYQQSLKIVSGNATKLYGLEKLLKNDFKMQNIVINTPQDISDSTSNYLDYGMIQYKILHEYKRPKTLTTDLVTNKAPKRNNKWKLFANIDNPKLKNLNLNFKK